MRHITFFIAFLVATAFSLGFRNGLSGEVHAPAAPGISEKKITGLQANNIDRREDRGAEHSLAAAKVVENKLIASKKPSQQTTMIKQSLPKSPKPALMKSEGKPSEKPQITPVAEEKIMVGPDGTIYHRTKSSD